MLQTVKILSSRAIGRRGFNDPRCSGETVFDAVAHFGSFCVVKAVERADKVAGDTPDAVKICGNNFVFQIDIVAVNMNFERVELAVRVLFANMADIGVDLGLRQLRTGDGQVQHHNISCLLCNMCSAICA